MQIAVKQENQVITVFLTGELDHHAVSSVKDRIDLLLTKTPVSLFILDLAGVTFMDSAGIGLIVGRYNRMKSLGGNMRIANPSRTLLKILKISGIEQLMKIG